MASPEQFQNLFANGNFALDDDDVDDRNPARGAAAGPGAAGAEALARLNEGNDNNNGDNTDAASGHHCWVFGYGSLCWHPGFEYSKCITGYIRGYVRRFWQGNTTHRGTEAKPGRVATLVPEKEGITWGCAYRIVGPAALEYLKQRECTLGGYATIDTKFFPRIATHDAPPPFTGEAIQVQVYVATPDNCHWMGPASSEQIAEEIATSSGPSGHNVEYLLRLAKFLREEIPGSVDEHLFELEALVMAELEARSIPLWSVMGMDPDRIRRDSHDNIRRPPSFEFTSRIPDTKLRCLNI